MRLPGFEGKHWREKIGLKNFHDHLRGQIEWQLMALFIHNALSCAVSQGNREGGKSHALSNKPTLYRQGLHSIGFITAVQMIRNVFSEWSFMVQVLPGVCTDQIHHALSWHLKEKTTAM